MRRCLGYLLLLGLACGGCRVTPEQRSVLTAYEHELRRYEDLIYELEYEYQILCDENESLRTSLAAAEEGDGENRRNAPRRFRLSQPSPSVKAAKPSTSSSTKSGTDMGADDDMGDLALPNIEKGPAATVPPVAPAKPATPPAKTTEPDLPPRSDSTSPAVPRSVHIPPVETQPTPAKINAAPENAKPAVEAPLPFPRPQPQPKQPSSPTLELLPAPADDRVSQLWIDPQATRGLDLDRAAGDEAVRLVVQPRNELGEDVRATGRITVVVIDPALQGEAARLGRWEFEPDQLRSAARRRRLELELPWQESLPQNGELALFVRHETPDGQKIENRQTIRIMPPVAKLAGDGWMPRSSAAAAAPLVAQREQPVDSPAAIAPASHTEPAVEPRSAEPEQAATASPSATETQPASRRAKLQRPAWKPVR